MGTQPGLVMSQPHDPTLIGDTLLEKGCPWVGATHLHQSPYPPHLAIPVKLFHRGFETVGRHHACRVLLCRKTQSSYITCSNPLCINRRQLPKPQLWVSNVLLSFCHTWWPVHCCPCSGIAVFCRGTRVPCTSCERRH